jgi:signal transduction histidine kinase
MNDNQPGKNIKSRPRFFHRLYWQVAAIFLSVLILFAAIAINISIRAARDYAEEVNQQLNHDLASSMIGEISPLVENESINEAALADIMHSMMVINPSVEVYILDRKGKILSYLAPDKVVKLEEVSVEPIRQFLTADRKAIIKGNDPRNPGKSSIFSAAPILENGQLSGYLYIVLASQEYVSTTEMVIGSYILGLSLQSLIIILLVSALTGLLAFWFLTKKLNRIRSGIRMFEKGDLKARIPVKGGSELDRIALAFNEMADGLEENIEKLKDVDQLRRELISNVSHDLRTPVASIQGYAETLLLKRDELTRGEREKYLEVIYHGCQRLQRLVTDLFELSKLQANQIKPELEDFSIAELVHDVANKYRLISGKKGISINTVVHQPVPLVRADISLSDRVLQNLIDNAIRFSCEGDTVTIEVDQNNEREVEISINDSGKGIDPNDLPHIFERYYKGSDNKSSGLGLAIVKKIIDLHNSKIEVESRPHEGTTFRFSLAVSESA